MFISSTLVVDSIYRSNIIHCAEKDHKADPPHLIRRFLRSNSFFTCFFRRHKTFTPSTTQVFSSPPKGDSTGLGKSEVVKCGLKQQVPVLMWSIKQYERLSLSLYAQTTPSFITNQSASWTCQSFAGDGQEPIGKLNFSSYTMQLNFFRKCCLSDTIQLPLCTSRSSWIRLWSRKQTLVWVE